MQHPCEGENVRPSRIDPSINDSAIEIITTNTSERQLDAAAGGVRVTLVDQHLVSGENLVDDILLAAAGSRAAMRSVADATATWMFTARTALWCFVASIPTKTPIMGVTVHER